VAIMAQERFGDGVTRHGGDTHRDEDSQLDGETEA
jgi:hypothetical protein